MTVLRLNHGLSRIPQIARILRSPERLSRNRGCFGFKRTAFGHGDPNEHRARGPERTSGTGTRTNIGHGDPNEQRGFLSRNRGCFGFKRTAFGHGDPNEHRARGPERTSGTGTRTNIGHGDPNEHRARGPERTKGVSISESRFF